MQALIEFLLVWVGLAGAARGMRRVLTASEGMVVGGVIALFMCVSCAMCSPSVTDMEDWLIDVWGSESGLPSSSITSIAQTPDGYLWLGTYNGLVRYDGVQFVIFDPQTTPELKHARVNNLLVDPDGTLWINTYDGSLVSLRNGVFRHEWWGMEALELVRMFKVFGNPVFTTAGGRLLYRLRSETGSNQWLMLRVVGRTTGQAYCQDRDGLLWYRTRDGRLGRVFGTNSELVGLTGVFEGQSVNWLGVDRAGRVWIGTRVGLGMWDGRQFVDQTPTNSEVPVAVSLVFFTRDGGYWAFANGRLRKCVGRQWVEEIEFPDPEFASLMPGFSCHEDSNGRVWLCHSTYGLFCVNTGGHLYRLCSTNGLPSDRVSSWFQDREDNIWIGTGRGGLVRLRQKRFGVLDTRHGLGGKVVMSVCEDAQARLWICTAGGGLNCVDGGLLTRWDLREGGAGSFFFSVCPDQTSRLWLSAGDEDLYVLSDGVITPVLPQVHGVKVIHVDRCGRVWLGRSTGLACLITNRLRVFTGAEGLGRVCIRALAEDAAGNIWAGGDDGVLYRCDGERVVGYRAFEPGLNVAIWALHCDGEDTVWVGTFRGGLLRYKAGEFVRYTVRVGMPSDTICQIVEDRWGNLWLGTDRGICRVPKSVLHGFATNPAARVSCDVFGLSEGVPSLECSGGYHPAAWRGRDGRLWFATVKGLVWVNPDDVTTAGVVPPVTIEAVLIDGIPVAENYPGVLWDRTAKPVTGSSVPPPVLLSTNTRICVPPGRHRLEFRFSAPSFVAPERIRFRYKLEGFDNDWHELSGRRAVEYAYVPPGEYRFMITTSEVQDQANQSGAAVALCVLPHFWETWWFLGLVSAFVLGGVGLTVRVVATRRLRRRLARLEQQRALERERARIAKDIHDDLGAGLTQILLQSAMAQRSPLDETRVHLEQISERARELIRDMDEIVWAVNPKHDSLESLATYLSKYAQEYLALAGIRCRLDLPETLPQQSLTSEQRHNLFLAVKEALTNVVKHAGATQVRLSLALDGTVLRLVISDDGRGFDVVRLTGETGAHCGLRGNGLPNMARRMAALGGRCTVRSSPGAGTSVELVLPLGGPASHKNVIG